MPAQPPTAPNARPFGIVMGIIVILIVVLGTVAGLRHPDSAHSNTSTAATVTASTTPKDDDRHGTADAYPTPNERRDSGGVSGGVDSGTAAPGGSDQVAVPLVYTVRAGDTLWDIARDHYGDPLKWHDIARANHLTHPQLIYPGERLTL